MYPNIIIHRIYSIDGNMKSKTGIALINTVAESSDVYDFDFIDNIAESGTTPGLDISVGTNVNVGENIFAPASNELIRACIVHELSHIEVAYENNN